MCGRGVEVEDGGRGCFEEVVARELEVAGAKGRGGGLRDWILKDNIGKHG